MAVSQIREHYLGRMQAPPKFCFAFRCHTCRPGLSIDTLERVAGLHQAKQGLEFGMKLAGGSVLFPSTLFLVLPLTSVVSEMDTSQSARCGSARDAQPGRLTHTLTISHP